ncbi:MAG: HD-GYP domain-containing protein, partial [Firmicutes bacterium]|nr:HD-GYP domain-containing protein [Bacillota bacterium]
MDVDLGLVAGAGGKRVLPDELYQALLRQAMKVSAVARRARFVRRNQELTSVMKDVVAYLFYRPVVAATAAEIKVHGRYAFTHPANVAVIAVVVGKGMGYSYDALVELGFAGLLHDVGKLRLQRHLVDKPGPLTDEEFALIREHTTLGYEMLFHEPRAAEVALQHHERWAGHGYPRGLRGEEIHPFAQIVGLADVFDAVTSNRIYRAAVPWTEALELVAGSGNFEFGMRYVESFFTCISVYPVGTLVHLNTGGMAVVTENRPGCPLHPRVRLFYEPSGRPLAEPVDLDPLTEP